MTITIRRIVLMFVLLLTGGMLRAHDNDQFTHQVDTPTLAGLQQGPRFKAFVDKKISVLVRTEKMVEVLRPSTAEIHGIMLGFYRTNHGRVDLTIHLTVTNGRIETDVDAPVVDAAVFAWQDHSPTVSALKEFNPQSRRLSFDSELGFHWETILERKFTYTLLFDNKYDAATQKIEDRTAALTQLKKFIAQAESDTRGRLILSNNASGVPAFVAIVGEGIESTFTIHHPLNDVEYVPARKLWNYRYSGPLTVFGKLPEVKRAQTNVDVQTFVASSPTPVSVSVSGNQKAGFDCAFFRDDGKVVWVRVTGKAVTALTK